MNLIRITIFAAAVCLSTISLFAQPLQFKCEKLYPMHLQGVDCDENIIYWSFSDLLVKTDWQGKELAAVKVPYHHGDLCLKNGKLYVAVNFGKFNNPNGMAKNFIYEYDAATLKYITRYAVDEVKHGAGAIAPTDNGFIVGGGLPLDPANYHANLLYEYDKNFKFVRRIEAAPWSLEGIQVIQNMPDGWLLAGHRNRILVYDKNFKFISDEGFNATHGIMLHPKTGQLYRAVSTLIKGKGWAASVYTVPRLLPGK